MPIPPAKCDTKIEETYKSSVSSAESSADKMYLADVDEKMPHLLSQLKLNDLVRDLSLSKEKPEILSSRPQHCSLLQEGTKVSSFRNPRAKLSSFCKFEDRAVLT